MVAQAGGLGGSLEEQLAGWLGERLIGRLGQREGGEEVEPLGSWRVGWAGDGRGGAS